ncbi:putative pre-16S rRNA nuclease [Bacteroidia bacterium]|nr:putative pre-16S rRNA nuclease [Bacteroidia bacterium]
MCFDYGQKRTGIAVSDPLKIIAQGLTTIPSHTVFDFVKDYLSKENVDTFVVGEAKQMDGTASESSKFIEPFVVKLKKLYPQIPLHRVDERFTSKMAFQTMIDKGLKKKDRQNKETVDKIAATIILQSYMS